MRTRELSTHSQQHLEPHLWVPVRLPEVPPPDVQLPAAPRRRLLAPLALAAAAIIWGVTFTVVDGATAALPPADLVAWRFGLGTAVLCLLTRAGRPMPAALHRRGAALGALLGVGFLLQAWALSYTDALMSGFLTSLLVVVAPIAGWLIFRDRLSGAAWAGVGLATAGVLVLSLRETGFGPGELLTLASTLVWGVHVVLLSRWAQAEHSMALARTQTATVTVLAVLVLGGRAAITGGSPLPAHPPDGATWISLCFLSVLATAGAMLLLSWSQSRVSAARAAIILTLEPAVSGLTAALTGSELTLRTLLGAALLLAAMTVAELGGRWSATRTVLACKGRLQAACRNPANLPTQPGHTSGWPEQRAPHQQGEMPCPQEI